MARVNSSSNAGQRVFITGGAGGLGLAIAKRYARAGWRVCIGDVDDTRGAAACGVLSASAVDVVYTSCDVTNEEDLQRVARLLTERWGGVDVVINNAGVACGGAIEDVPASDWRWAFDINVFGVVNGCRVFTRLFKQQGHGYLVNVSSMAGLVELPLMSCYNASKAAVVSISETLRKELASYNIGVTVVCPAFFRTNIADAMRTTDPRLKRTLARQFEKNTVSAESIADEIFEAQGRGRLYVLPHLVGVRAWYAKRLLPRACYEFLLARAMPRPARSKPLGTTN